MQPQRHIQYAHCVLSTPLSGHGHPFSGAHACRHSGSNGFAGLPPLPFLQTTKGKVAKSITIQEWTSLMEGLRAHVDGLLSTQLHPLNALAWFWRVGSSPAVAPPIFSFDNASVHVNQGALIHLGISAVSNWEVLPPHSGDLHRVIERVHARVCGAFQDWLYDDTTPRSMAAYCQKLESLFYSMEKAHIHAADIGSIHLLYQQVVAKDGGLPPVRYR